MGDFNTAEPWVRATPHQPCPICGRKKYCQRKSTLTHCTKELAEFVNGWKRIGAASDGFSLYVPDDDGNKTVHRPAITITRPVADVVEIATVSQRNRWYRALLNLLTFAPDHQANLKNRGMTDQTIITRQYRTLPASDRFRIMDRLLDKLGEEPVGIPGFYKKQSEKDGKWYWLMAGSPGILIPIEDLHQNILGFQIRKDVLRDSDDSRYTWFSSAGRGANGTSSGAPVHIARPASGHLLHPDCLWITEGPMKADILAQFQQDMALAVPGVAVRKALPDIIQQLDPKWVIIAYDMDAIDTPEVAQQTGLLIEQLVKTERKVSQARWDSGFNPATKEHRWKGIDDAIVAGVPVKFFTQRKAAS